MLLSQQQLDHLIISQLSTNIYLVQKFLSLSMSFSRGGDAGFPWFEEQNFTGWLVQFRAHLRKAGTHVVLDRPRPSDLDAQGNPIPINAPQRRTFNDEVA